MILDLDEPAALDAARVGAKAAALARARQGGLPVLPGFVVETAASSRHMGVGAGALDGRGSGGARLAVLAEPIQRVDQIVSRARQLGDSLVARSSSPLEGAGRWAGAFATYVGISPVELPKAVAGCWASAFSVDALDRQRLAGIEPGSMGMAVLVQPAITPRCGGVAELGPDGAIAVHAVAGSPALVLQGWEPGVTARRRPGGRWIGEEAIALIGDELLDELGSVLARAVARLGIDRCEWGMTDRFWLLQVGTKPPPVPTATESREPTPAELIPMVREMIAAPGVLGSEVLSASTRIGVRPWEPLVAAVVLDHGTVLRGTPAAAGIGAGLSHHVARAGDERPWQRAVVTAERPLPKLSQHIWDAAGLVTGTGSPAAHVFEAARSLGVPAVCGVEITGDHDLIVAVDGSSGLVATLPLAPEG